MRRLRVSTLMLLVVIAALGLALVVQGRRAARREIDLRRQLATLRQELLLRKDELSDKDNMLKHQSILLRGQLEKEKADSLAEGNGMVTHGK